MIIGASTAHRHAVAPDLSPRRRTLVAHPIALATSTPEARAAWEEAALALQKAITTGGDLNDCLQVVLRTGAATMRDYADRMKGT